MDKRVHSLTEQFIVSPYSVLDSRTALWQNRKRAWKERLGESTFVRRGMPYDTLALRYPALYAESKEERERLGIGFDEYVSKYAADKVDKAEIDGTMVSSLDPVLAELMYHWFTIPGQTAEIVDPFAGGFYEGGVASTLGHHFYGIDIRESQVESNNEISRTNGWNAKYICDNSQNISKHIGSATMDFMLTSPPYHNLAEYDGGDTSRSYEDYLTMMKKILTASVGRLKMNRFAAIVISDVRASSGSYRDLPGDVIRIMQGAGMSLWNELILITQDASSKLRARPYMRNRKVVRTHQKVLVFYKGRPSVIPKLFTNIKNYD